MPTNREILRAVALLLTAVALQGSAACSSAPDLGKEIDETCAETSRLYCAKFAECGPLRFPALYASVAECERVQNDWCHRKLAAPDIAKSPGTQLACNQAASALSCDDWYGTVPDACLTPAGPRPEGSPCLWSAQCSTRACAAGSNAMCGVCARRRAAGEECDDARPCEERLACTTTEDAPGVCVAEAKPGESCLDRPCSWDYQAVCVYGTCVRLPQLGENCEALYCGWWQYCDPASLTCMADRIVGPGESCAAEPIVDGQEPQCGPGLYCDQNTFTCAARGLPADACGVGTCVIGQYCILGLCGVYDDKVCPSTGGAPLGEQERTFEREPRQREEHAESPLMCPRPPPQYE